MKWSFTLWTLFLPLLLALPATAQVSCEYTLRLIDDFGDGWSGASLSVTIDGNSTAYTLDNVNDDGNSATIILPVTAGDTISLEYTSGFSFVTEPEYLLLDALGDTLFLDGQLGAEPMQGLVYSEPISCPACPPPLATTVEVDEVRAFRAELSWVPSDPEGEYQVEYGAAGFEPGTGIFRNTFGATLTLFNLEENTSYDFFLTALCSNGDTSMAVGPYTFKTLYANDVGITEILAPMTGCELGAAEKVSVLLSNFGGTPQSLIPFNFSVNGIPGGVTMPQDGFFTGVVGTDSMEVAEFDAAFDFSELGEYVLEVWTELEADSVISNDTTSLLIVNIPLIQEFPYFDNFETWGGGWTVQGRGNGAPSWEYGTPGGSVISTAASGSGAWVTNLSGLYNNNELSYLLSPCFDFSSLEEDPRIAFSLNVDTENNFDRAWLEVSTNGGQSWSKVGQAGTGINWYNDFPNNYWENNGGADGWRYAQNILEGTAGAPDVRVRFVFSSDNALRQEGVGIDNILVSEQLDDDLVATLLNVNSAGTCGSPNDTVNLILRNLGANPASGFSLAYSINGGEPVVENAGNLTLDPDEEISYTFQQTFDSSEPGTYVIMAWASLEGDDFPPNDTITFVYRTSIEAPFREDFEAGALPEGWSVIPDGVEVDDNHNAPSFVLFDNLWSGMEFMQATTPAFGPIGANDTLAFDYRYVNFGSGNLPTLLTPADSLVVQLSLDCGETFFPVLHINGANHIPSASLRTVEIPLADYEGEIIVVRFQGYWGGDTSLDYFLDLDNITIRRCPPSLLLEADITPVSSQGAGDGAITIIPNDPSGPFTYEWSTGDTDKTVSGLDPGTYKITVANAFGCTESLELVVPIFSSSKRIDKISNISLAPNPTTGSSQLRVEFANPVDARIQLINAIGQPLFERVERNISTGIYELDLRNQPGGLFFVRIFAEGEVKTAKLLKIR